MTARTRVSALLAVVCAAAAVLALGPAAASAAFGERALREGMTGTDVEQLQRKLTNLGIETGVDGVYGQSTKRSVKRWERRSDRSVNGRCSRKEARLIKRELKRQRRGDEGVDAEAPTAEPEPDSDPSSEPGAGGDYGPQYYYASRKMSSGTRGTDVAELQRYLSKLGLETPVDGTYGSSTRGNLKKWEAWQYLRADGVANKSQAKKIQSQAAAGETYVARENVFPVRGPHDYGGAGARFGAPRSGRTHRGQDVAAAHGTPLVAVHSGNVAFRQYQAGGAGHYVVIQGRDGSDSVYMHMPKPAIVKPGEFVRAGERIGRVGNTGASTGPHLHFELWTPNWYDGGDPYDPLRKLKRWDRQTP